MYDRLFGAHATRTRGHPRWKVLTLALMVTVLVMFVLAAAIRMQSTFSDDATPAASTAAALEADGFMDTASDVPALIGEFAVTAVSTMITATEDAATITVSALGNAFASTREVLAVDVGTFEYFGISDTAAYIDIGMLLLILAAVAHTTRGNHFGFGISTAINTAGRQGDFRRRRHRQTHASSFGGTAARGSTDVGLQSYITRLVMLATATAALAITGLGFIVAAFDASSGFRDTTLLMSIGAALTCGSIYLMRVVAMTDVTRVAMSSYTYRAVGLSGTYSDSTRRRRVRQSSIAPRPVALTALDTGVAPINRATVATGDKAWFDSGGISWLRTRFGANHMDAGEAEGFTVSDDRGRWSSRKMATSGLLAA